MAEAMWATSFPVPTLPPGPGAENPHTRQEPDQQPSRRSGFWKGGGGRGRGSGGPGAAALPGAAAPGGPCPPPQGAPGRSLPWRRFWPRPPSSTLWTGAPGAAGRAVRADGRGGEGAPFPNAPSLAPAGRRGSGGGGGDREGQRRRHGAWGAREPGAAPRRFLPGDRGARAGCTRAAGPVSSRTGGCALPSGSSGSAAGARPSPLGTALPAGRAQGGVLAPPPGQPGVGRGVARPALRPLPPQEHPSLRVQSGGCGRRKGRYQCCVGDRHPSPLCPPPHLLSLSGS